MGGGGPRRRRRHGRRREASAVVGRRATVRERGGEERGNGEGLTARPASARTRSGMPGSSRIDGEYPRRPEARMATAMAPRDAPSCLARRGGRGGRGGARGLYGGARGRRGARRWRAAAAAVLRVRGRESRGRGGGRGRVRAVRGSCVATFRTSRRRGGGQAGRCRGGTAVRTRRPDALASWREVEDDWR